MLILFLLINKMQPVIVNLHNFNPTYIRPRVITNIGRQKNVVLIYDDGTGKQGKCFIKSESFKLTDKGVAPIFVNGVPKTKHTAEDDKLRTKFQIPLDRSQESLALLEKKITRLENEMKKKSIKLELFGDNEGKYDFCGCIHRYDDDKVNYLNTFVDKSDVIETVLINSETMEFCKPSSMTEMENIVYPGIEITVILSFPGIWIKNGQYGIVVTINQIIYTPEEEQNMKRNLFND